MPNIAGSGFWTEAWLDGLADVQLKGLTEAVGVSNFSAKRTREAAAQLRRRGVQLSSNQIQYSLLYRTAETNGMLEACLENGVTPVAYSPLAQGLLTGKYRVGKAKPDGLRQFTFSDDKLRRAEPLLALMDEIGKGRGVRGHRCCGRGCLPLCSPFKAPPAAQLLLCKTMTSPALLPNLAPLCCAEQDAVPGGDQLDDVQGRRAHSRREERAPGAGGGWGARLALDPRGGRRSGQGEQGAHPVVRAAVREVVRISPRCCCRRRTEIASTTGMIEGGGGQPAAPPPPSLSLLGRGCKASKQQRVVVAAAVTIYYQHRSCYAAGAGCHRVRRDDELLLGRRTSATALLTSSPASSGRQHVPPSPSGYVSARQSDVPHPKGLHQLLRALRGTASAISL